MRILINHLTLILIHLFCFDLVGETDKPLVNAEVLNGLEVEQKPEE